MSDEETPGAIPRIPGLKPVPPAIPEHDVDTALALLDRVTIEGAEVMSWVSLRNWMMSQKQGWAQFKMAQALQQQQPPENPEGGGDAA